MLTSSDVLKQQQSQRLSASLSVALLRDDLRAMLLPAQRPLGVLVEILGALGLFRDWVFEGL